MLVAQRLDTNLFGARYCELYQASLDRFAACKECCIGSDRCTELVQLSCACSHHRAQLFERTQQLLAPTSFHGEFVEQALSSGAFSLNLGIGSILALHRQFSLC